LCGKKNDTSEECFETVVSSLFVDLIFKGQDSLIADTQSRNVGFKAPHAAQQPIRPKNSGLAVPGELD
jgi:hypothetical protein